MRSGATQGKPLSHQVAGPGTAHVITSTMVDFSALFTAQVGMVIQEFLTAG